MTDQLIGTLFHIGYVVPELDLALAHFQNKIGALPFKLIGERISENGWFRGSVVQFKYRIAVGFVGDMQFEIIEPIEGVSTFAEYLERLPQGGVHHLGYAVEDYESSLGRMALRGYQQVQRGTAGNTRMSYYESSTDSGTITEIVWLDEKAKTMFQNIKSGTF